MDKGFHEKPKNKGGRPRSHTPESLMAKFEEYVTWAKNNPRFNSRILSDGSVVQVPLERPLTVSSFAVFAGIIPETFREYEKRDEYSAVCAHVRAKIESDQMEGALCEQFNPTIASRVLHLADRQDITSDGKPLQTNQLIPVTVDVEAASIIQSIGRRSINTINEDD